MKGLCVIMICLMVVIFSGMSLAYGDLLECKLAGVEIYDEISDESVPEGGLDKWRLRLEEKICGVETINPVVILTDVTPQGIMDHYIFRLEEKLDGVEIYDDFRLAQEEVPKGAVEIYGNRLKEKLAGVEIESNKFSEK